MLTIYVMTALRDTSLGQQRKVLVFFDNQAMNQAEWKLEDEGWETHYTCIPASNGMVVDQFVLSGGIILPLVETVETTS